MNYKDSLNFMGKTALITGAAGGMGAEICSAFASCGANVILADMNEEGAREIEATLAEVKGGHLSLALDLGNLESMDQVIEKVIQKFGKIDFLINHAGLNIRKPAVEFTESDWEKVQGINLKGAFFMAQKVAKEMIKQGGGKIVTTASVSAVLGHPNLAIYAATKGGIAQFTKVFANEWAKHKINVNAVGPGYVVTKQTKDYVSDPKVFNGLVDRVPMKKLGEPSNIAGAMLFLCSPLSDYITGQLLLVDGGRTVD